MAKLHHNKDIFIMIDHDWSWDWLGRLSCKALARSEVNVLCKKSSWEQRSALWSDHWEVMDLSSASNKWGSTDEADQSNQRHISLAWCNVQLTWGVRNCYLAGKGIRHPPLCPNEWASEKLTFACTAEACPPDCCIYCPSQTPWLLKHTALIWSVYWPCTWAERFT